MTSMNASDFCQLVTDGTHDSPKPQSMGRYLITSKHLGRYKLDFSKANLISEEDYRKVVSRSPIDKWDILFSMIGTVGNIFIETNETIDYACKNVGIFKMGGDERKAKWLYYYLQSPKGKAYVNGVLRGTTQKYIPLDSLRRLPVDVVSETLMNKITDILWKLDEKIALNEAINHNLQELLLQHYKLLFNSASKETRLSDICSYSIDRIEVAGLRRDNYYSTENMLSEKRGSVVASSLPIISTTTGCRQGDVLVSNIRPYFKKIVYCQTTSGCSTDVLCFRPENLVFSAFLYFTLYDDLFFNYIVAGSKGTKMPRGDKQQIMRYPTVYPSSKELEQFNSLANPTLKMVSILCAENSRLAVIRDTLLPRLMTGDLDVSSLEY